MKFIQIEGTLINLDHITSIYLDGDHDGSEFYSIAFDGGGNGNGLQTRRADFETEEERKEAYQDIHRFIKDCATTILYLS